MPLLSKLQDFLYNRALRKFRSTNLGNAPHDFFKHIHKVGIVFDAAKTADREAVIAFADQLRKSGTQVWLLGYFNTKTEEESLPFDFFDPTQLSFARLPKSGKVRDFIGTQFDLLINLDNVYYPPLNYIVAASRALFKIGPAGGNPAHYDLMVETSSQDLRKYIDEIRRIFNKISG